MNKPTFFILPVAQDGDTAEGLYLSIDGRPAFITAAEVAMYLLVMKNSPSVVAYRQAQAQERQADASERQIEVLERIATCLDGFQEYGVVTHKS